MPPGHLFLMYSLQLWLDQIHDYSDEVDWNNLLVFLSFPPPSSPPPPFLGGLF